MVLALVVVVFAAGTIRGPGEVIAGLVALAGGVATLLGRLARRHHEPEPDLGPPPVDGFSPEATSWYERKREAEERAAFRSAYEVGLADARRERAERLALFGAAMFSSRFVSGPAIV